MNNMESSLKDMHQEWRWANPMRRLGLERWVAEVLQPYLKDRRFKNIVYTPLKVVVRRYG
jgi:hypothetical protein